MITSSSVSSSSSTTSTNGATVFVPIQVTKTRQNLNHNNNKYNTISTTTNTDAIKESQKGYRYVPKQLEQVNTSTPLKRETQTSALLILTVSQKKYFFLTFFSCILFLFCSNLFLGLSFFFLHQKLCSIL